MATDRISADPWRQASATHDWPTIQTLTATTDTVARAALIGLFCAQSMISTLGGVWASDDASAHARDTPEKTTTPPQADRLGREVIIAGYGGVPVTHASDVSVSKPGGDDFSIHSVEWFGRPFKSPIYYGVRVINWGTSGRFGSMLDFTHSKTISMGDQTVQATGTANGAAVPETVKISDLFKRLEFSHGHNMLTFNGMMRLGSIAPNLSPYVGFGLGVNLPHSEVQLATDAKRTYKYQYTGPVGQALVGLEFRTARASFFVEYKFSLSDYTVPISQLQDTDIGLFGDLWVQAGEFWRGTAPISGTLETTLASHNFIAGAGVRLPLAR